MARYQRLALPLMVRYQNLARLASSGVPALSGCLAANSGVPALSGCLAAECRSPQVRTVHTTPVRTDKINQQTSPEAHISPYGRIPFFHERGPGIGIDKSLQERLDELFGKDPVLDERVDIGFAKLDSQSRGSGRGAAADWRKKNRSNRELEKAAREGTLQVEMSEVREEWINSGEVFTDIFNAAELYGVYEDLYNHGYFHPCLLLDIAYVDEDDVMTPVYRGNIVKPREATTTPEVSWKSNSEDDLWCLMMTSLDTHLTTEGAEYLHWMVGNIQGSDISSGDELVSYLPPFPPYGTGYHRYVFVMYKQEQTLDLTKFRLEKGSTSLQDRTFNTFNFYSEFQDLVTPAGLAFFQSDYDSSLRYFFHNVLNMKEPRFEYEYPEYYIPPWRSFAPFNKTEGFDEFLDRHRDPKDIEKQVLELKLKHNHPFKGDLNAYMKYPGAHGKELLVRFPSPIGEKQLNRKQSYKIAQWRRNQIQRERLKEGYFSTMDHHELRRDPKWCS